MRVCRESERERERKSVERVRERERERGRRWAEEGRTRCEKNA